MGEALKPGFLGGVSGRLLVSLGAVETVLSRRSIPTWRMFAVAGRRDRRDGAAP
jgi:hypothetical protein